MKNIYVRTEPNDYILPFTVLSCLLCRMGSLEIFLLKMGQPQPLFRLFSVFFKQTI